MYTEFQLERFLISQPSVFNQSLLGYICVCKTMRLELYKEFNVPEKYICSVSIYIKQIVMYVIRSFVSSVRMSTKNSSRSLKMSEWNRDSTLIFIDIIHSKMK